MAGAATGLASSADCRRIALRARADALALPFECPMRELLLELAPVFEAVADFDPDGLVESPESRSLASLLAGDARGCDLRARVTLEGWEATVALVRATATLGERLRSVAGRDLGEVVERALGVALGDMATTLCLAIAPLRPPDLDVTGGA